MVCAGGMAAMPYAPSPDGTKLYYEEAGSGVIRWSSCTSSPATTCSWEPQLLPLRAPLPLHRLQRPRLPAVRRARGSGDAYSQAHAAWRTTSRRCSTTWRSTGPTWSVSEHGRLRHPALRPDPSGIARARRWSSPAAATARRAGDARPASSDEAEAGADAPGARRAWVRPSPRPTPSARRGSSTRTRTRAAGASISSTCWPSIR